MLWFEFFAFYYLKFMLFSFNKESDIFTFTPGRAMPGAPLYSRRNAVDFKVSYMLIVSSFQRLRFRG